MNKKYNYEDKINILEGVVSNLISQGFKKIENPRDWYLENRHIDTNIQDLKKIYLLIDKSNTVYIGLKKYGIVEFDCNNSKNGYCNDSRGKKFNDFIDDIVYYVDYIRI